MCTLGDIGYRRVVDTVRNPDCYKRHSEWSESLELPISNRYTRRSVDWSQLVPHTVPLWESRTVNNPLHDMHSGELTFLTTIYRDPSIRYQFLAGSITDTSPLK